MTTRGDSFEVTGVVGKAYQPGRKTDYTKFYFTIKNKDGTEIKGMAPVQFLQQIRCGNVVEVKGAMRRGWLTPHEVHVWREPELQLVEEMIAVGHVGQPRQTHYGLGCSARLHDDKWLTIPCKALTAFFEGNGGKEIAYEFPGRGRGQLTAKVFRQGHDFVVGEILAWHPLTKTIEVMIPFDKIFWTVDQITFTVGGQTVRFPTEDLPFDVAGDVLKVMPSLPGYLTFTGILVAHSEGVNRIGWTWSYGEVKVEDSVVQTIEHMVYNDRVARAIKAVKGELRDLWAQHLAVDLTMVHELFLKQGVTVDDDKVREVWARRDYDYRYMRELEALAGEGGRIWAVQEGFIVLINDWLVWEIPQPGRATYILPATPNEALTGEPLTLEEWVSVLGRVLPATHKMQVRYGEVGQALAGSVEGVQFAFHVTDDDGQYGGWLQAVKDSVSRPASAEELPSGLPSLDDILALAAGEEEAS
jgi:hypothetical protein